jgi:carbamoyltransferase
MSTSILGISAFYHDAAATLVVDGKILAAAQEERFTRKKHDADFPANAVAYCCEKAGLALEEIDHVVFYEKPLLKFERLLETYLATAPLSFRSFLKAMPVWFHQKLRLPREMNRGLQDKYRHRYIYTEHHESHAASAFYPSPFEEAAILTIDGVGEWATASIGHGKGHQISLTQELQFPHSLGLLYSAFTYYCGFKVNSGEYKLMGLAPYGQPVFADLILNQLMDLRDDGSFRLDLSYFNYCHGLTMTSDQFHRLFGAPPRAPESPLTENHLNIAASIQQATEVILLKMAAHAHAVTDSRNLCLAGGVALNCVGNGRLLRESPFEKIWIQPAAGDAGGSLGAALFVWHQLLENKRPPQSPDGQQASLLGPAYVGEEVENVLREKKAIFRRCDSEDDLCEKVAALIDAGKVVGWVQGRMEFGPRGLGSRSILADARSPEMQKVMNLKIKFRESFRPFAPIVLQERAQEFFELKPGQESPYMLLVAPVRAEKRLGVRASTVGGGVPASGGSDALRGEGTPPTLSAAAGLDRVNEVRSVVPAVTHVDYSARIQTVDRVRQPRLHALLEAFERRSGCPVLINTSFNIRGEPIVCTPADAYRCFMATDMDVLVIDTLILLKKEQPAGNAPDRAQYRAAFGND